MGKGGDWLLPFLCSRLALDPHRTAIVGDRMDTDIHLGRWGLQWAGVGGQVHSEQRARGLDPSLYGRRLAGKLLEGRNAGAEC